MQRAITLITRSAMVLGLWLATAVLLQAATLNVPSQYSTIQAAINAAASGDTVQVAAGTYAENLIIGNAITLRGPNAGVNPNTASRNPEAVIIPATTDMNFGTVIRFFNGTHGTVSDVTIDGLTIDGDNPNLGTAGSVDAMLGIGDLPQYWCFPTNPPRNENGTSLGWETNLANITIQNNIIRNLGCNGIALLTENACSTGNVIANNKISNLKWVAAPTDTLCWDGIGIFLRGGVYAQVSGNNITGAQTGIVFSLAYIGAGSYTPYITNNYIECFRAGIFNDIYFSAGAPVFDIEYNTIVGKPHPTAGLICGGIWIISSATDFTAKPIANNTIQGCQYGIFLWNCHGGGVMTPFTNNQLTNNTYGVYATNYTPWWNTDSSSGMVNRANVTGGAISGSSGAGIFMDDRGYTNCPSTVNVSNGTGITGGSKGVLVSGGQNTLTFSGNDVAPAAYLSAQSGDYFTLQGNTAATPTYPGDVDARYVAIEGYIGSQMSSGQLAAAEAKITDKHVNSLLGTVTIADNNPRIVRVEAVSGVSGGTVTVPISLISQGNEHSLSFSLSFDKAVFSNPTVAAGSDAAGASVSSDSSQTAQGRFGVTVTLPGTSTFTAGTRQIVIATFKVVAVSDLTTSTIGFVDQPIARQIPTGMTANWQSGTIMIPFGYEADVTQRPYGKNNGTVTVSDWVQIGRFAAGLDLPYPGSEFQRADCAPRAQRGDGKIDIADWVQAGRYAAGLDPVVTANGPTSTTSTMAAARAAGTPRATQRMLSLSAASCTVGKTCTSTVTLRAQGDENGVSFSLKFDPTVLQLAGVKLLNGAKNATININTLNAADGQVGIMLALPAGKSLTKGMQSLVQVTFRGVAGTGVSGMPLTFSDQPVSCQVVNANAEPLPTNYANTFIRVIGKKSK